MPRPPASLTVGLGLAALLGFALVRALAPSVPKPRPTPAPPPVIPNDADVVRMTASISGKEILGGPVPEFTIPDRFVPRVLATLRPVGTQTYPASWDYMTLGRFTIATRDGRTISASFGLSIKVPLAYNFDGVRLHRGGLYESTSKSFDQFLCEGYVLEGLLRSIHREVRTGEQAPEVEAMFRSLDQSAGRAPPDP